MKKLVFMLFFVFTALSINANGIININKSSNCYRYAMEAANAEKDAYNTDFNEWKKALKEYYNMCVESNSSISSPVFL